MDDEHEQCAVLIQRIEKERSLEAMEEFLKELVEHFEHEEKLLAETGFGSTAPAGLSPLITHTQDHKRIIRVVGQMLAIAKVEGINEGCVKELAELFETHAVEFDSRYTEYLATF